MIAPRFLASLAAAALAAMAGAAGADYRLTILHFNDFHSRFEPISEYGGPCSATEDAEGTCFGGVARMKTWLDARRAGIGDGAVLTLAAGDLFQGSLFYTTYKGAATAEAMNALGPDALALGNHEFDDGPEVLSKFIAAADFPVISGNTDVSAEPLLAGELPGYTIVETGGEKIGIVALLATDTGETASPGPNVTFGDEIAYLERAIPEIEAQGVDKIIALTHVGLPRDREIAAAVAGIDVIVGGHSHSFLSASDPKRQGPYPTWATGPEGALVPIVQAYAYSKYIGALIVDFDDAGNVLFAEGDTILLDASVAPDAAMAARVAELAKPLAEIRVKVVAETTAPIDGDRANCRVKECEMGVLVAEAMLAQTAPMGVAIAIVNGGGLRASIDAGPVTMGEALTVLPFRNTIATMKLKGADVVAALENGVSRVEEGAGRFPQVAGLRYAFDATKAPGARITAVEVKTGDGWAPIAPETVYGVVTNDYMRGGGDGYAVFRDKAVDAYDYGPNLEEAVAAYLGARSPYRPVLRGDVVEGANFGPAAGAAPRHVVRAGDTLWDIAKTRLGDATLYTEIIELNGLSSGAILSIGRELKLPEHAADPYKARP